MKKNIIFMILICALAFSLCGSASAADNNSTNGTGMNTTQITQYKHVYINVSNDNGVKYNLDYDYYLNDPANNINGSNGTYYIRADGGGMNQLHITNNSTSAVNGQVNVINSTSTSSSGVFYITTTGGRGSNDDIILMLSIKGPIPDNFNVTIISNGYTWTLPAIHGYGQPTSYSNVTYITGINETFTKSDFLYGPQTQRPAPTTWQPFYAGQNTSDNSTAEYFMFIDLYTGNLASGKIDNEIDNGAVKVQYTINNLYTTASFNAYAWAVESYQYEGINWCNPSSACGVTVNYKPVAPVADFTADNTTGSNSLTVKFTDNSTNYPTSWTWDFGDSKTSNEQNPTHTYTAPGTYTVKLTASNSAGYNTLIKTSYITVLDTIAPVVTADPAGGNYSTAQTVTLNTTDASSTTTYYTTDGSDPTTSSNRTEYTGAVSINSTTTLKFAAIDAAGNWSPVYTENYNIKSDVYVDVTPSKTNPQVGDKVTYKFKLGNNGPGIANDVVFTYVIPEGVEFDGATVDQGTLSYDESTRTLTWNVGNVTVGDPYLWLNLKILNAESFNIQPTITTAGYNPELQSNIGSLLVNAVSATTNNSTASNGINTVKAATTTSTVPMQDTGLPIAGLVSALLLVGSGLALGRKK